MATVLVPTMLRSLCEGVARLDAPGGTLDEVLRTVDRRFPGFYARVVDGGTVRPELAVAVDGEASGFSLHEPVPPDAEVAIIPAISGG